MSVQPGGPVSVGTGGALQDAAAGGTGDLTLSVTPESATWTLYGPGTYNSNTGQSTGTGSTTLSGVPAGVYTLALDSVANYLTPGDKSGVLSADSTLTLTATYVDKTAAGTIGVLATCVSLLQDNANTTGYYIYDYFGSPLSRGHDKMETGVIEIDTQPNVESEIEHFHDGLAKVTHRIEARIHRAHPDPKTARDNVLIMVEEFKEALETANQNLGMLHVRKDSLRFESVRTMHTEESDGFNQLDIRTAIVRFSCIEYQSPRARPNAG